MLSVTYKYAGPNFEIRQIPEYRRGQQIGQPSLTTEALSIDTCLSGLKETGVSSINSFKYLMEGNYMYATSIWNKHSNRPGIKMDEVDSV